MVRTLTVVIGLAMSLLVARDASADRITPVDLDSWVGGSSVNILSFDQFLLVRDAPAAPPNTLGIMFSDVLSDGTQYTYAHWVTSYLDNNDLFATQFSVGGFSGIAGWSFSDALRAGGTGTDRDFLIDNVSGRLNWFTRFTTTDEGAGWDAAEPITFFFVSSRSPFKTLTPPGAEAMPYGLLTNGGFGTAQGLAPVPEPGSIALFGSGLMGLYAAVRRRRSAKG
jgi:PEP-CTERM motif